MLSFMPQKFIQQFKSTSRSIINSATGDKDFLKKALQLFKWSHSVISVPRKLLKFSITFYNDNSRVLLIKTLFPSVSYAVSKLK